MASSGGGAAQLVASGEAWAATRCWWSTHASLGSFLAARKADRADLATALLSALADDRSDGFKMGALQLMQEQCAELFPEQRALAAIDAVTSLLLKTPSSSTALKSQLLTTATTLMICLDHLQRQPADAVKFIDLQLLGCIATLNDDSTALLRQVACQCLLELEEAFPGLLAHKLGHLSQMAQDERGSVAQTYALLFATALDHAVLALRRAEAPSDGNAGAMPAFPNMNDSLVHAGALEQVSLLSTAKSPLKPFLLPRWLSKEVYSAATDSSLVAASPSTRTTLRAPMLKGNVDDIKRGVSLVCDQCNIMSPAAGLMAVHRLARCVRGVAGINPKVFKPLIGRQVGAADPQDWQSVLLLDRAFGRQLLHRAERTGVWHRLQALVNLPAQLQWRRSLMLAWLLDSANAGALDKTIHPSGLFPTLTEGMEAWPGKLDVLARLLSAQITDTPPPQSHVDATGSVASSFSNDSEMTTATAAGGSMQTQLADAVLSGAAVAEQPADLTEQQAAAIILKALSCFAHFVSMGPRSMTTLTLYRALLRLLAHNGRSTVSDEAMEFVLRSVRSRPELLGLTVELVDAVCLVQGKQDFAVEMLSTLHESFLSRPVADVLLYLRQYIQLLQRLATLPAVNPAAYLSKLLEVLKSSAVCAQGTWDLGNAILSVCQTVLRCSWGPAIQQPLGDTLLYMWQRFGDVDIRDQARFTYMLLTNVSGAYLKTVLEPTQVSTIDREAVATLYNDYVPKDGGNVDVIEKQEGVKPAPHKLLTLYKTSNGDVVGRGGGTVAGGGGGGLTHRRSSSAGLSSMRLTSSEVPLDTSIYEALKGEATVLHDYATHLAEHLAEVSVGVRCVVAYEIAPSVARLIKPPARLFAVRLAFDTDAQYRPIAEIHVPRLVMPEFSEADDSRGSSRKMSTSDNSLANTMAAYRSDSTNAAVTLHCQPEAPIPAVVRVTAEYTDDAGASFRSTLEDLRIDFGDLYCEPMYPPHWPAEGGACYAYRLALFDQLWAFIEERVNAEDEESNCMLSVKHLPVQRVASQQILRAAFSRRFLVAQVPQPRSSGGAGPEQVVVEQWYYLILLPPQHHLLLRCTVRETSSDVHVATDAWRCLPFLESELQAQLEAVDSSSSSS